jgi:hypothetical protein
MEKVFEYSGQIVKARESNLCATVRGIVGEFNPEKVHLYRANKKKGSRYLLPLVRQAPRIGDNQAMRAALKMISVSYVRMESVGDPVDHVWDAALQPVAGEWQDRIKMEIYRSEERKLLIVRAMTTGSWGQGRATYMDVIPGYGSREVIAAMTKR